MFGSTSMRTVLVGCSCSVSASSAFADSQKALFSASAIFRKNAKNSAFWPPLFAFFARARNLRNGKLAICASRFLANFAILADFGPFWAGVSFWPFWSIWSVAVRILRRFWRAQFFN